MIVAGVGFRRGVGADEILDLVARALAQASVGSGELSSLATLASRAGEAGFTAAAARLGVAPLGLAPERLAEAEGVETRSARIMAFHGVGSLAEAAALSAAGPGARLLVARLATARATCAIATGPGRP